MSDLYRYNFSSEYGVDDDENGDYVLYLDYKFLQEQLEQRNEEIYNLNVSLDLCNKASTIFELRNEKLERVVKAIRHYKNEFDSGTNLQVWESMDAVKEALNQLNEDQRIKESDGEESR